VLGHEYPIAGDQATVSHTVFPGLLDQVDRLLLVSSGYVDVEGGARLELLGPSWWTGGKIVGTGVVANLDSLTIDSAGPKYFWSSATLENQGVVRLIAPATLSNHATVRFENGPGAIFELQGAVQIPGAAAFVTEGTLRKSTGVDTARVAVTAFEISGDVEVRGGALRIQSATFDAIDAGFDVETGAALLLDSSTYTGTFAGSGAGHVELGAGHVYTLGPGGVVFDFPGEQLQWSGGIIQSDTLTNSGTINLSSSAQKSLRYGAVLDNSDTVLVSGGGGLSNHADVAIVNGSPALFEIRDGGVITGGSFANDGILRKSTSLDTATVTMTTFDHTGRIEVASGGLELNATAFNSIDGDLDVAADAVLRLGATTLTGVFDGEGAGTIELFAGNTYALGAGGVVFDFPGQQLQWSGGIIQLDTLTNLGTINLVSSDWKSLRFGLVLDNRDTVLVSGGGVLSNHANVRIENAPGALFEIQDGGSIANGSLTNEGIVRKSTSADTATISMTSVESSGLFEVSSGGLQLDTSFFESIGGSFYVAAGSVVRLGATTLGGTFAGGGEGIIELYANQTYSIADSGVVLDFPPDQLHWSGGFIQLDTLTNLGALVIDSSETRRLYYGVVLDNQGSVQVRDEGDLVNHSNVSIDNRLGAVFDFQGTATVSNGVFTNHGLLSKTAGAGTATLAMPTTNFGTVEAASGTLTIASTLTNSGGEILLRDAAFDYSVGTLDLADGSLRGTGTIVGDARSSAGQVRPGLSAGRLVVAGDFQQDTTATLAIEIGDLGPGGGHDVFEISGSLTLAGALEVSLIDQFEPRPGDSFPILEYGFRWGGFTAQFLPDLRNDWYWTSNYDATTLTLGVEGTGPVLGDIVPGLADQLNSLTLSGAEPGAAVGFAWGVIDGSAPIAPCPGADTDIADPHLIAVTTADASGEATVASFVPASAAGLRVFVQAVDLSTCLVTNRVRYDFP